MRLSIKLIICCAFLLVGPTAAHSYIISGLVNDWGFDFRHAPSRFALNSGVHAGDGSLDCGVWDNADTGWNPAFGHGAWFTGPQYSFGNISNATNGHEDLGFSWTKDSGNSYLPFNTDINPTSVPEPSTMILIMMGLIGSLMSFARSRYNEFRRFIDLLLASAGMAISAPIVAIAAILIKLDSPGPVFYEQERVGENRRKAGQHPKKPSDKRREDILGRPFKIYKLRTMQASAEQGTGPVWASKNDCRITRTGKILRMTRIDELPQFINVLKGDMSIIGPRPERPVFVKQLDRNIRNYNKRFHVKPGITGLAQVRQGYTACIKGTRKKLRYDLLYAKKRGLPMDIQILFNTVGTVLFSRGAR